MSELKQTRLVTPTGRLAFNQNLFKTNDKGRYSIGVVFDMTPENMKALEPLKGLMKDLIKEKWGDKVPSKLFKPMKVEDREEMLEKYEFMKDRVTLNASNGFEVPCIDLHGKELFDGDLKAGDHVKVSISGYAYDNVNKGVGFNVNGVQLVEKGEAFYGRQSAADMFGITPASLEDKVEENEAEKEEGNFDSFGF